MRKELKERLSKVGIAHGRGDDYRAYKNDVFAKIRKILHGEWDPIGCGVPEDEYSDYENTVWHMVNASFSRNQIAKMLDHWSTDLMYCPQDMKTNLEIADKLLAIPLQKDWT